MGVHNVGSNWPCSACHTLNFFRRSSCRVCAHQKPEGYEVADQVSGLDAVKELKRYHNLVSETLLRQKPSNPLLRAPEQARFAPLSATAVSSPRRSKKFVDSELAPKVKAEKPLAHRSVRLADPTVTEGEGTLVFALSSPDADKNAPTQRPPFHPEPNHGVGIILSKAQCGRMYITHVDHPSSAHSSALVNVGDVLLQVGEMPLQGLSVEEASALLRGPEGSTVEVVTLQASGTVWSESASVHLVRDWAVTPLPGVQSEVAVRKIAPVHGKGFKSRWMALRDGLLCLSKSQNAEPSLSLPAVSCNVVSLEAMGLPHPNVFLLCHSSCSFLVSVPSLVDLRNWLYTLTAQLLYPQQMLLREGPMLLQFTPSPSASSASAGSDDSRTCKQPVTPVNAFLYNGVLVLATRPEDGGGPQAKRSVDVLHVVSLAHSTVWGSGVENCVLYLHSFACVAKLETSSLDQREHWLAAIKSSKEAASHPLTTVNLLVPTAAPSAVDLTIPTEDTADDFTDFGAAGDDTAAVGNSVFRDPHGSTPLEPPLLETLAEDVMSPATPYGLVELSEEEATPGGGRRPREEVILPTEPCAEVSRYKAADIDLDLTYITDSLIVMAHPLASGNSVEAIARFLNTNHHESYQVYSLYGSDLYAHTSFHGGVVDVSWADVSGPPPVDAAVRFCCGVDAYLRSSPANVAVLHCTDGMGACGVMACAYLLYSREVSSAQDALDYFDVARSCSSKPVISMPSHRRWVGYLAQLVRTKRMKVPQFAWLCLDRVRLAFDAKAEGCSLLLQLSHEGGVSTPDLEDRVTRTHKEQGPYSIIEAEYSHVDLSCSGDVCVAFFRPGAPKPMFRVWFNTRFVQSGYVQFNSNDIDVPVERSATGELIEDPFLASLFGVQLWFGNLGGRALDPINEHDELLGDNHRPSSPSPPHAFVPIALNPADVLTAVSDSLFLLPCPNFSRNSFRSRDDLERLVNAKHCHGQSRCRVFDLCHDTSECHFDQQNHEGSLVWNRPPRLHAVFALCSSAAAWLSQHPENIVVLACPPHSEAAGVVAACQLYYSREAETAEAAIAHTAMVTPSTGTGTHDSGTTSAWEVRLASMRRWVTHFSGWVRLSEAVSLPSWLDLHSVRVVAPPSEDLLLSISYLDGTTNARKFEVLREDNEIIFVCNVMICGEVHFLFSCETTGRPLFGFWVHSSLAHLPHRDATDTHHTLTFPYSEIDVLSESEMQVPPSMCVHVLWTVAAKTTAAALAEGCHGPAVSGNVGGASSPLSVSSLSAALSRPGTADNRTDTIDSPSSVSASVSVGGGDDGGRRLWAPLGSPSDCSSSAEASPGSHGSSDGDEEDWQAGADVETPGRAGRHNSFSVDDSEQGGSMLDAASSLRSEGGLVDASYLTDYLLMLSTPKDTSSQALLCGSPGSLTETATDRSEMTDTMTHNSLLFHQANNNVEVVMRYLQQRHPNQHRLYVFSPQLPFVLNFVPDIVRHCPFHTPGVPSLQVLWHFCKDTHDWICQNAANVAVLCCDPDPGPSALMACAYLLYAREFLAPHEVLQYYALCRSPNDDVLPLASQKRYLSYIPRLALLPPSPALITANVCLRRVRVTAPPIVNAERCELKFSVASTEGATYFSAAAPNVMQAGGRTKVAEWGGLVLSLVGDITVLFLRARDDVPLFGATFHAEFVAHDYVRFNASDTDVLTAEASDLMWDARFRAELFFVRSATTDITAE